MSNDPYLKGRYGGGNPPSGPDFGEWSRGNEDRLKGLQQGGSGDSAGPLLGDDPHAEAPWPPPQTFSSGEDSGVGGNPNGFTVDSGCAVLLLTALAVLLLPVALVTWVHLHPSAQGHSFASAWLMRGVLWR